MLSLDRFQKNPPLPAGQREKQRLPLELAAINEADLTKAGRDFRLRFTAALEEIMREAARQIACAKKRSDVKIRITVAAVAKRAKASRLGAYSPLHRDALVPLVESASLEHEKALSIAFIRATRTKPTVTSLTAQIRVEREEHAKALSALASQKLTTFLSLANSKSS